MKQNATRGIILKKLRQHMPQLRSKYGIQRIALFGSFARDTQTRKSDVDLLVELSRPLGFEFVRLADDLEKILGRKVDLATFETYHRSKQDPRKRRIAEKIEKELVYIP